MTRRSVRRDRQGVLVGLVWMACACGDDATQDASVDSGSAGMAQDGGPQVADARVQDADAQVTDAQVTDAQASDALLDVPALLERVEGRCESEQPLYPYTVRVVGAGLDGLDGRSVAGYTRMGLAWGGGDCVRRGLTTVSDGGFSISLTSLSDGAAYPDVALWIDRDGDGACDASLDLVYRQIWTVGEFSEQTLSQDAFATSAQLAEICLLFDTSE